MVGELKSSNLSPPPPPLPSFPTLKSDFSPEEISIVIRNVSKEEDPVTDFLTLWTSMQNYLNDNELEKYTFSFIPGYLQNGPTCGLVALYMIAEHLCANVTSIQILDLAINHKFTSFGEMFSAKSLYLLTQKILQSKANVSLEEGNLLQKIPEALFHNYLILIPYDTDKNYEPCLKDGKKAHWAVLCGVAKTKNNLYVVARQSKSRHFSIWNLEKLINSNSNLREVGEIRSGSIVPKEGLSTSLAGYCIVIKNR